METRKVLVNGIPVIIEDDKVYIGDMPQLIVDIKTQENYIRHEDGIMSYYREIALSRDLLEGKRENVMETAVTLYYTQACQVVEGMKIAEAYRNKNS